MRTLIFLSALFLYCSAAIDDYELIDSIPFPADVRLTTDHLGNAYIMMGNQLLQFNHEGKPVANYSERNLGVLKNADVGNPMKILLFYPDFARILILDSKLSVQSTIDLRSIDINQPLTACMSNESGYWVYDREDDQLKKLDFNLQVIQKSENLTQRIGYQVQPLMMMEENGNIYMNNPETGILVFDRFGTYYKTIPYKGLTDFQVINNDVLFITKGKFFRYDGKTLEEKEILLPSINSIRFARIENRELFLLTNESLNFYSF